MDEEQYKTITGMIITEIGTMEWDAKSDREQQKMVVNYTGYSSELDPMIVGNAKQ